MELKLYPRAASWLDVIANEFMKRNRQIEQDNETKKVTLELILGKHGNPVIVRYLTTAECRLTSE